MRSILPVAFAHRIWPANACHMTTIRAEVTRWLNDLSASPDIVNNVVLAVTEAVVNCVEHAYHTITEHNTIEVTFWTEGSVICIQISDHGSWRPPPATVNVNGQARGLTHMSELVESVMIRFGTSGTNVLLRQPVSITSRSPREGWSA
jgi:serine/threonine-protein kinase RsbW